MSEECLRDGIKSEERKSKSKGIGGAAIFGICLVLILIIALAAWCVYAYKHPTSKSGLFLIEVRFASVRMDRLLCYTTEKKKNWSIDTFSYQKIRTLGNFHEINS